MKQNKTVCLEQEVCDKLAGEANMSELINTLLEEHFKKHKKKEKDEAMQKRLNIDELDLNHPDMLQYMAEQEKEKLEIAELNKAARLCAREFLLENALEWCKLTESNADGAPQKSIKLLDDFVFPWLRAHKEVNPAGFIPRVAKSLYSKVI